ncbi:GntR family transcriptional regulator [Cloacibacillus evryensis]|uniref:GntR family transcriptional regulator n=1 Tax=Cloacibacillus evryensis TaxID=508460 RepID=UPI00210B68B8|nr:GntR family transcriptional regulator [Cloacibacillus evryensis]MCQ4764157.1 GntR family transcriptional regulator [Cloacibacillus evryensis]
MPIKTTAQDAALEQIMELIQRKEIFPGARLFETDLEKSLGMSRTPIRGALDQLVVDGILEKKQNQRGYFFPKLTLSDLYEAYIFRERLEVTSVSLACLNWNHQAGKKYMMRSGQKTKKMRPKYVTHIKTSVTVFT